MIWNVVLKDFTGRQVLETLVLFEKFSELISATETMNNCCKILAFKYIKADRGES